MRQKHDTRNADAHWPERDSSTRIWISSEGQISSRSSVRFLSRSSEALRQPTKVLRLPIYDRTTPEACLILARLPLGHQRPRTGRGLRGAKGRHPRRGTDSVAYPSIVPLLAVECLIQPVARCCGHGRGFWVKSESPDACHAPGPFSTPRMRRSPSIIFARFSNYRAIGACSTS